MLPILKMKQKPVGGLIVQTRPSDVAKEDQNDPQAGHMDCAKDLIAAIHAKDAQGVLDALEALKELGSLSSEKDVEPHSYDAQNKQAAKDE